MPPAVWLVTDSTLPSGMGRHMLELARALRPRIDVSIVAPGSAAGLRLLETAESIGVPSFALPDATMQEGADALRRMVAEAGPETVHVHAGIGWEGIEMARAARAGGARVVVRTEHLPYLLTEPLQRAAYAEGLAEVDRVICVSAGVAATFVRAGVPPSLVRVVPNGIDPARPRRSRASVRQGIGIADAALLVTTVGRFTPQKGYDLLFSALPTILAAVREARFVWVGEGPLREDLGAALDRARLRGSVRMLDAVPDVPALLAASDLVVAPSRFEGLSLVVLEAMAAGRAVVATRVVGLEEAVDDGRTGRLVPAEDPDALALAVTEALADPARRAAWGAAGQARQRARFGASLMAERTLAVYADALASAGPPSPVAALAAVSDG